MGRKREKALIAGDKTTLYIPKEIKPEIISWMNAQNNLAPEIFNAINFYITYKDVVNNTDLSNIDIKKLISEEIAKQLNGINTKDEVIDKPKKLTPKQKMMKQSL